MGREKNNQKKKKGNRKKEEKGKQKWAGKKYLDTKINCETTGVKLC